jgi:sporulation protein YlmC with PRC-barrel domain
VRLELGSAVRCADGALCELADLVVDPVRRRVTHIVVEPHGKHALARLVPVDLIERAADRWAGVSLRCTAEELRRLAPVQEFAFLRLGELPLDDPDWDVGVQDVLALPYYGNAELFPVASDPRVSISYDRVPKDEVELRRASAVFASDGRRIGHVDGLLVDSADRVTHLVLERGHLWGRREITIPIGAVARVQCDSVTLTLTTAEVAALPSVPVRRWRRQGVNAPGTGAA